MCFDLFYLSNKKISTSRQKSNFAYVKNRDFVFIQHLILGDFQLFLRKAKIIQA